MSIRDVKGYELIKEEDLKGIKARGYLLRHKKSGARVIYIQNDDNNKVLVSVFGHRRMTVQECPTF